ncbi:hypothetical protein C8R44DRAFT_864896 [Mycena epipterygia]|nr:hypothetical protein C8R44DRAFT_864896 [Mycena epipterygia]
MSFTIRTDRVRIVGLLKRKSGLSKEEFSRYWANVHGPLFHSFGSTQINLLKYEQAHINQEMFDHGFFQGSGVDGIVIFEAESYSKMLEKVMQSDEFQHIVLPDADKFIDTSELCWFPLDLIIPINK